ncbi:tRNA 2-thiouridine(34) synthase MnmA [Chromatium okenii]|uniref:tRNA 2-thiouridine(34) synthase MnmA n=1 Tax=Chromatium okenii TaxID=61644 RepID=UPI001559EDFE
MKNWEEDDRVGYCAAAADLADAQAVAQQLGIRLHTVNFATEYWDRVFAEFLSEYQALRTPNPDVLCNREIKFAAFLDYALDLGADAIATGHYARITQDAQGFHLRLCADAEKDQTYFLHLLNQAQLAQARFPLHAHTKPQIRAIAQQLGLPNAIKKTARAFVLLVSGVFGIFSRIICRIRRDQLKRLKVFISANIRAWRITRSDNGKVWASAVSLMREKRRGMSPLRIKTQHLDFSARSSTSVANDERT